jgi:hypothetical protein
MTKRREKRSETGIERQQRIQREQHRPEQERGYDQAVNSGPPATDRQTLNAVGTQEVFDTTASGSIDVDDREADAAAMDVRRREHSD